MKKISFLFVLGFLALTFNGFSQTKCFEYDYDDSGNRDFRAFITLKSGHISAESGRNQIEQIETTLEDFDVVIYPNPTKGNIKVAISGLADEEADMYVFNMQGKLIANKIFNGTECTVNLTQQPAGMYLMKIQVADKNGEWKIIKE